MSRPQQISDTSILAVVQELRRARLPATGVNVRRELQRRYGLRASTDRVYRLIHRAQQESAEPVAVSPINGDVAMLVQERDDALERAKLAEMREMAAQDRTALEIDRLRQALRLHGVDPFTLEPLGSKPFRV